MKYELLVYRVEYLRYDNLLYFLIKMFSCCMPPSYEPVSNLYLKKLQNILKVLGVCQLVLGLLELFSGSNGFTMVIGAIILFCIIRCMNWCCGLLYIFISLMDIFNGLIYIGETFFSGTAEFSQIIIMIKVPLLIITVYYTFLTYKELKAISIENAINAGAPNLDMGQRRNNDPPPRRYFDGTGHRLS